MPDQSIFFGKDVLLTRPRADSERLAELLAARGMTAHIAPVLDIVPVSEPLPPLDDYHGLIFTSAHAARLVSAPPAQADKPVFCVGDHCAATAAESGWRVVHNARGDGRTLESLVRERCAGREMRLFHLSGADISHNFGDTGCRIDRHIIYRAVPAGSLPEETLRGLDEGRFFAALFFSARTARIFAELTDFYGRTSCLQAINALCLGDKVLESVQQSDWRNVQVAQHPDVPSMIDSLISLYR